MNWRTALASFSISARSWARYQGAIKAIQWLGGYSPFPLHLDLVLTWRCNLACPMCNLRQEEHVRAFAPFHGRELTTADWCHLLDDVKRSFPFRPNINLLGGEPTLYAGYLEIATHAKQAGFRCTFVTNGTTLARDAERLVATGVDVITVSLDGDEALHDRIRGKGVYRRAVEGIRRVQEARRASGLHRPRLFMATAISGANYNQLSALVEMAHALGLEALTFLHLQFPDSDLATHGIEVPRLLEEMARAEERARALGLPTHFYPYLKKERVPTYYLEPADHLGRHCLSPWLRMSILPEGTVVACENHVIGQWGEGTLRAIWNGPRMRAFRKRLAQKGTMPSCGRCCRRLF